MRTVEYTTLAGNYLAALNGHPVVESTIITTERTIITNPPTSPLSECMNFGPNYIPVDGGYNMELAFSCQFNGFVGSPTLNPVTGSYSFTNPNISLSSFGYNGGPTPTFVLPTGSPAIDKIPDGKLGCGQFNTPGAFDQRGVPRPQGLQCDIGAIEHLFSNLPTSGSTCNGV